MIPGADPAGLGPVARRAEIARILALGYLRLLARRNALALGHPIDPDAVDAAQSAAQGDVDAGETKESR